MKAFFIFFLLLLFNLHSNELEWVDKQVNAIKPSRIGTNMEEISNIKDPFIYFATNKEKVVLSSGPNKPTIRHRAASKSRIRSKNTLFFLSMIMNKSAKINNQWYKIGDTIKGYRIAKIHSRTVLLTKKNTELVLSTFEKNPTLNFKH